MRIYAATSSAIPGSGKAIYRTVLENEGLKRDFLLAALVNHYPNLTTKGDLTYNDLKHRLRSLAANGQLNTYNGGNTIVYGNGNGKGNNNGSTQPNGGNGNGTSDALVGYNPQNRQNNKPFHYYVG